MKRIFLASLLLLVISSCATQKVATAYSPSLHIPPRAKDAIGGAAFMDKIKDLPLADREAEIYKELSNGNIPNAHRKVVRITEVLKDANGVDRTVEYEVLPDFLTIGSDEDFCRIPMLPETAQRIATLYGGTLPTSKLSDLIYKNAEVKLSPRPMTPDASMTTIPVFVEHNDLIEEARKAEGKPLHALIAGHKKDIVISNLIASKPTAVIIYGWHRTDGRRIQPIYSGHSKDYVDYSHGVRIINQEVLIDGVRMKISDVLKDEVMYKLLSDESGLMEMTGYPVDGIGKLNL